MPPPIDVCIRGAGVVGRSLALLLARERLHVGLVEQAAAAPGSGTDVRAYALNAASRKLLQDVRAWPDDRHAEAVLGMEVRGDAGGAVNFHPRATDGAPLAWIADVPALQQRLGDALRYQPLVKVLQAPVAAPLTVVCEGRSSSTRSEFGVQFDVTPYGQQAIAARLVGERPHGGVARQWFLGGGDVLALLPLPVAETGAPGLGDAGAPGAEARTPGIDRGGVPGVDQGAASPGAAGSESPANAEKAGAGGPGNAVALVWSVADARATELLALSPEEFAARVEALIGTVTGKLRLTSQRAAWPLQLALAREWCGPGWALAGDAAHTVHPLAGQGLNLGLADACALAQVLHERAYWRSVGDLRLLRAYERARKADVIAMGAATDGLQQLFAQGTPAWGLLRNWGMKGFDKSGPVKNWVARQAAGGL